MLLYQKIKRNIVYVFCLAFSFFMLGCSQRTIQKPKADIKNSLNLVSKNSATDTVDRIPQTHPSMKNQKSTPSALQIKSPSINKAKKWVILSSYSTLFNPADVSRTKNIKLTTKRISGYMLQSGEVFSFNDVVGKADPEKGYKKAPILLYGKKAMDYGGGVCQVSTTLYNAVKEGQLKVLERHSHSKNVDYVSQGKDATIVYGSLDFKFKNNKTYPIMINIYVDKNKIIAIIAKQQ